MSYFGGKNGSGTYQKIINEVRPCDIFISAFAGKCGIINNFKTRPDRIIAIDIDAAVSQYWAIHDQVEFYLENTLEFLPGLIADLCDTGSRIVIYYDPPYVLQSRKNQRPVYNYEMTSEQHSQLVSQILTTAAMAPNIDQIVSHYPHEIYYEAFKDWRILSYNSTTRSGSAEELLFMNYDHISGELQDYSYIGDNKDERYNLKHRTAKNLISKLENMEPRKRKALLYYLKKSPLFQ